VRLIPLGGLGEIGLNMMAVECRGKILIIDCGLMFPEAYMFGIDLVIPDVSALSGRIGDICGLVLTHGQITSAPSPIFLKTSGIRRFSAPASPSACWRGS
jgi:hypothetical protein